MPSSNLQPVFEGRLLMKIKQRLLSPQIQNYRWPLFHFSGWLIMRIHKKVQNWGICDDENAFVLQKIGILGIK